MRSPVYYHKGIADADSANQDGTFVAMYGMEYGVISSGGHVIVYGSDKLFGWDLNDYDVYNSEYDYAGLFAKVKALPNAFAYLCHPMPGDYTGLLSTAPYSLTADSAIVGSCSRSGPAFSTNNNYTGSSTGNYINQWQDGLAKGYHLGIGLDHDTHNSVFGRQSAGRLVILATALTRANVYDAFKKRHFYSSDDWNAQATFTVNAQPMGTVMTMTGNPVIHVSVMDPDSEKVASIQLFYGVPGSGRVSTVLTSNSNSRTFDFTPAVPDGRSFYYYAEITQADGDVIWTSPIWYTRNDFPAAAPVAVMSFPSTLLCSGTAIAFSDSSAHVPTSWAWSFPGASTSSSTLKNPTVTYPTAGTYTVSLTATNANGNNTTSQVITVDASPATPVVLQNFNQLYTGSATTYQWYLTNAPLAGANQQTLSATQSGGYSVCVTNPSGCSSCSASFNFTVGIKEDPTGGSIRIYPNPSNGMFQISFDLQNAGTYTVELTNILGQVISSEKLELTAGSHVRNFDASPSGSGMYLLTLKNADQQVIRKVLVN